MKDDKDGFGLEGTAKLKSPQRLYMYMSDRSKRGRIES
jgi:hypothetical protein